MFSNMDAKLRYLAAKLAQNLIKSPFSYSVEPIFDGQLAIKIRSRPDLRTH
jgi:hypothetical protein